MNESCLLYVVMTLTKLLLYHTCVAYIELKTLAIVSTLAQPFPYFHIVFTLAFIALHSKVIAYFGLIFVIANSMHTSAH